MARGDRAYLLTVGLIYPLVVIPAGGLVTGLVAGLSQDTRDGLAGRLEYKGRFAAGYVDGFGPVLLLGFAICSRLVFGLASTELARVTHVRLVRRTW